MTISPVVSFRSNHPVPTPPPTQQPQPPQQPLQYFTGEEAQEEKKGTNPLLLLGGLALAGLAAFAFLRKGKGAAAEKTIEKAGSGEDFNSVVEHLKKKVNIDNAGKTIKEAGSGEDLTLL